MQLGEQRRPGEQLVAVGARQAARVRAAVDEYVEQAAGTTVGVGDEHVALRWHVGEQLGERRNDPFRPVVQVRRQVAHVDRIGDARSREHRP